VKVLVLNGPNLGRLGRREPEVYGRTTHADLVELCRRTGGELGLDVEVRQTEHEGELLGWLHEAADAGTPVVLNAGAWTHTSIAIGDACAQLTAPLVEVHISNVYKREPFRHHSYVSAHASGLIVGLGVHGYLLALRWLSGPPRDEHTAHLST
jgi:3-dehydroquinate dehydratase-2